MLQQFSLVPTSVQAPVGNLNLCDKRGILTSPGELAQHTLQTLYTASQTHQEDSYRVVPGLLQWTHCE